MSKGPLDYMQYRRCCENFQSKRSLYNEIQAKLYAHIFHHITAYSTNATRLKDYDRDIIEGCFYEEELQKLVGIKLSKLKRF